MKQFRKPEYHFVRKDVKLDGGKIAELSDEELKSILMGTVLEKKRRNTSLREDLS